MDLKSRNYINLNHQENTFANKNKAQNTVKGGLQTITTKRTALGDISSNIRNQPVIAAAPKGKTQISNDIQKPAARPLTRSYKNITAKVDSRLLAKVPSISIKSNQKDDQQKLLIREDSSTTLAAKTGSISNRLKQTKISSTIPVLKPYENLLNKDHFKLPVRPKVEDKSETNSIIKKDFNLKEQRVSRSIKAEAYSTELLDGVEDIDSGDGNSPILMGIYIKDIYNYLMDLELSFDIKEKHLNGQLCVTPKMRAMLIDWLVEVHQQFTLMLETLHLTVGIIDRYLQLVKTVEQDQIQLVGITALLIASKYEEMFVPDIQDFVYITDNTYTKSQILKCEREILIKLKFSLGRPIPLHFERRFIKAARVQSKNHYLAKYLIDLCLVEYGMAHYRPSEIAASAVCLSISILSPNSPPEKCWTPTLAYYSGYKYEHISEIIKKIAIIARSVETSRFKAVFHKYNSSKQGKVPSFPELRGPMIRNIAGESPKS